MDSVEAELHHGSCSWSKLLSFHWCHEGLDWRQNMHSSWQWMLCFLPCKMIYIRLLFSSFFFNIKKAEPDRNMSCSHVCLWFPNGHSHTIKWIIWQCQYQCHLNFVNDFNFVQELQLTQLTNRSDFDASDHSKHTKPDYSIIYLANHHMFVSFYYINLFMKFIYICLFVWSLKLVYLSMFSIFNQSMYLCYLFLNS